MVGGNYGGNWYPLQENSASGPLDVDCTIGCGSSGLSSYLTNTPSTAYTLAAGTTLYAAGNLIANSATAGSVTVPIFAIANSGGGALIGRAQLVSSDTAASWQSVQVQVDVWGTVPTFTNGDHGAYLVATGSANLLGSFICTFQAAVSGDGNSASCYPSVGNYVQVSGITGTSVYWTMKALTASVAITTGKTMTFIPAAIN